ncbi:leucine-rich repeat domain-containing protein [Gorillibacterium timonense]|uniref:leucine-rich repeat domain-containing protein n=1 Tax=Gorillibacterium timonense TaxID=1689269 RepID=UPI00071E2642|nr:leucine-rich repeat domain-containing protein [Gorillibacterium timonense]
MRRRPILSITRFMTILIISALLGQLLPPSRVHAEGVIFGDSLVEQVVRQNLAKEEGPITEADLRQLDYLTIPTTDHKVKSLKGLEGAVNIQSLDLDNGEISDLSPLSGMKKLVRISLHSNQVTNLSPLASLTDLKHIDLYENKVKDLTPLKGLVKLKSLSLSLNQVSDLSPLASLTELTSLELYSNPYKTIAPLGGLVKLETLVLGGSEISDLTPLSSLTALKKLNLYNSKIKDVSPLGSLGKLEWLSLSTNLIQSIEPLRSLVSLKEVRMDGNEIRDLSPIVDLPQLTYVAASNNYLDLNAKETKAVLDSLRKRGVDVSEVSSKQKEDMTNPANQHALRLDWSSLDNLYERYINTFAYGNGIYVMPVSGGYVKTSKDGLNWKQTYTGINDSFITIIWGNNMFMGFREAGLSTSVWTSKDGVTWTKNEKDIPARFLHSAVWNGKRYVMTGGTMSRGIIVSSEDGLTWTERKSNVDMDLKAVAWGNGTFVAQAYEGGLAAVSKDGITWKKVKTNQPNYEQMWSMAYGGGNFVAVGEATIMISKDGVKWTSVPTKTFWNKIFWAKDRFYAYGFEYINYATDETKLINSTSKDGKTWSAAGFMNSPVQTPFVTLHNGKQYITVTAKGIQASTDGMNWKQTLKYPFEMPSALMDSAVGNGKLVMVGGYHDTLGYVNASNQASVQLNASGKWTSASVKKTFPLNNVVWTGKDFFAVGDSGKMMTSTDGLNWTALVSPTKVDLTKALLTSNGTYYVTGEEGLIMTSKDRKKWTVLKTGVTKTINSIETNGKTFVAVGKEGLILTSDDGVKWSQVKAVHKGDNYDVVWGNGKFVISTSSLYVNVDYSVALYSTDGKKWKAVSFIDGYRYRGAGSAQFGVSFIDNLFVAVGSEGSIFLSDDAEHWTKQTVMTNERWFYAAEFQGKVYVFGDAGKIIVADLKSLRRSAE